MASVRRHAAAGAPIRGRAPDWSTARRYAIGSERARPRFPRHPDNKKPPAFPGVLTAGIPGFEPSHPHVVHPQGSRVVSGVDARLVIDHVIALLTIHP